ncbi:MAG: ribulokinase, partial [Ardenticatenia bacterium]|nr:ribulokinase [Ardenticatenia bacterium]
DWIVWQLTGHERRSICCAGYKGMWSKREGYPSEDFFAALDPRLRHVVDQKLSRTLYPLASCAGGLRPEIAGVMGLRPGIAVSVGIIDAHASVPAATVVEPGRMVIIMGTSNCHMVLADKEQFVEGVAGVVEDGIIPGYFGYEAGQAAVGDIFGWFVKHGVPPAYHEDARRRGISVHKVLEERAARQRPGEHGLLALDWWNGSRSVLMDADLSGLIVGMTLHTRPEDIYRALLEATAFGTRLIIETFEQAGIRVEEIIACGGLPERNPLLMQIYADVTGRELRVAASAQASALGAAMHAAVAAGAYATLAEAARHMAHLQERVYRPVPAHTHVYDRLFAEYVRVHDHFGRGAHELMHRLKRLRGEVSG